MPPPAEGLAARLLIGPALRTQPDRRLVALVRDGYESAFEEIVRRYGAPLRSYAARIVGGRAEDVTQDAFSKALLALRRDDAEIELRPWLFRIVRNTALNELRDSPPPAQELAEALAGDERGGPAEQLARREELRELIRGLRALPQPQRAAIVMRELEGLGHEEIAAALGLSGGAARQAIYRARQALREGLGMLLPLPLVRTMLATGGTHVEVATGSVGLGTGAVLKVVTATVLIAGAVGTGVAVERHAPAKPASGGSERLAARNAPPSPPASSHTDPAAPREGRGERGAKPGGAPVSRSGGDAPSPTGPSHALGTPGTGERGGHSSTPDDGEVDGAPKSQGNGGSGGSSGPGPGPGSAEEEAAGDDSGPSSDSEEDAPQASDDEVSSSDDGSGSGSGPESETDSGGEGGGHSSEGSGDSEGADGFSVQATQP